MQKRAIKVPIGIKFLFLVVEYNRKQPITLQTRHKTPLTAIGTIVNWTEEFLNDVPGKFLKQIHAAVNEGYLKSEFQVESQGLGLPEKKNLLPWQRRAQIEHRIKSAALKFSGPVEVTTENSGFWNHVVITCGRFRITQSAVPRENSPLNPAEYKCKYANQQTQLLLNFGEDFADESQVENHFYAVVLHHAPFGQSEPDFVSIRFPSADLSTYHPESIDLAAMFNIESSETATPVENIPDTATPKLKKKKRTSGEA